MSISEFPDESPKSTRPSMLYPGGLVWIVDDSPLQLAAAQKVLGTRYEIATFRTGEDVLERLSLGALPDLLVLDWEMPGISGVEVCRFVRERHDPLALPVLLLTARGGDDDVELAFGAGTNDYIAKPWNDRELLARASTLVRVRQQARTLRERDEQIRGNEAQWRLVMDALPVLVSFVTADERYGLVNKAYEDWFGLPRERLLGRKVRDIIGDDAYAILAPKMRRGLAGERFDFEQQSVPYRFGGVRDVKVAFVPHHDKAGVPVGYTALLEDVTMARRSEKERERYARQKTEVLESMGDAFLSIDPSWRIILVNREFAELSGRTREALVGEDLWDLFPEFADPDAGYLEGFRRCMSLRTPVQFLAHRLVPEVWTDVRAYATAEGGISVFFRDITAAKKAEQNLQRRAEFERQLIGIVSHDLRNPLNVVLMASHILKTLEELSAPAAKHVARIHNAGQRATRLILDLLDFTQARMGGGIRVLPRASDLHAVTRGVLDEIEAAHPGRRITVRAEGDGRGEWDPDRLGQVVQNLVTNALKYSPPESPVEVITRGEEGRLVLEVRNEGVPIPEDKRSTLFEPFERAIGTIDSVSRSVGLGLYIVKQVVEAHGGTVVARSTAEDGTTLTVQLPRVAVVARGEASPDAGSPR